MVAEEAAARPSGDQGSRACGGDHGGIRAAMADPTTVAEKGDGALRVAGTLEEPCRTWSYRSSAAWHVMAASPAGLAPPPG